MATRLYGANPGFSLEDVSETVGSPTTSNNVELTVDLSTSIVTDGGTTRALTREEVLQAILLFQEHLIKSNWPPV